MRRTFIGLPTFLKDWQGYNLSEDDLRELENFLLKEPKQGDLVQGSSGVRKIRWSRPGMGKRGGVRVFYYDWEEEERTFFLAVISKSDSENISKAELKILSQIIKRIRGE